MPVNVDIRDQILSAATRLFAARGYDATPLQEIADAVGIRKPSLLYHFPSKSELRRSVFEKIAAHWNEALPRLLRAATSGPGQFDAVVEEMVAFFTADPDRARLIIREILDRPDEVEAALGVHVRSWAAIVCDYIRKGQAQGRVYPDVDPEAYVVQVINLVIAGVATYDCVGVLVASQSGADQHFVRHVRELLRVARRGLFLPEPVTLRHEE
jgi:AcrR family transcriptional regulator